MPAFIHELDITDEEQIVEHFQHIPDITEYILDCERYPFQALRTVVDMFHKVLERGLPSSTSAEKYRQTISKIEIMLSTRVDYVTSLIDSLLDDGHFDLHEFSLDESPTKEILVLIDLMKDVSLSPEINPEQYKMALLKFIKTLKFRFNKALEIHKKLYLLKFEDLAEQREEFPKELLEEHKGFVEDALAMTRKHVSAKPIQIHQLKETLFKILEAMGVRVLQARGLHARAEYSHILEEIEDLVSGLELDFGQKIADRFSDMLAEYIASHWNFDVIKHNRKLVELLIDQTEDAALLSDLYQTLIHLTTAESIQHRKKQELIRVSLKDIQGMNYVKDEANAVLLQMEKLKSLDIIEQARELIKLSLYGLCEYLSKFSVEELSKYPIGIIKSTEKMLTDLEQHRLRESEIQTICHVPEYSESVVVVEQALMTYDSSQEKHNFVDIYKEADFMVDGVTYCAFNDIILRLIQNIMEAYFVVDSDDQKVSEVRLTELKTTIVERFKTEWMRQSDLRQQSEQQAMEELAEELI